MIKLEDYLKNHLSVFNHIMDCAGLLLEKRAMNHAPTPEEMAQLNANSEEIKKNLEQMERDAKGQVGAYEKKIQDADNANRQTIDQLTAAYAEFDRLKAQQSEHEIELEKVMREEEAEIQNLDSKKKEISACESKIREAQRIKEEKRKKAVKWCWVPGYNIYLACDYGVEAAKSEEETLKRQIRDCEKAIEQFAQRAGACRNLISEISDKRDALSAQCDALNRKTKEFKERLAGYKTQLVYWEDMRVKVSDLISRLSVGSMAPDDLAELMDMMEMFGEGI